jgi:hypothetical protein
MPWLTYLSCFGAGLFLANGVPHFVQGVSGNGFPTPFARPPGKGLSSAIVNVWWGLLNLVVGALLFHAGQLASGGWLPLALFFAGVAAISTMAGINFAKKHKE